VTVVFLLLVLAVLGAAAAVATNRIGGGLEQPASTLAPVDLLAEGPISAGDFDAVRFTPALRGYRMDEVDLVLQRLTEEMAQQEQEIDRLRGELRRVDLLRLEYESTRPEGDR